MGGMDVFKALFWYFVLYSFLGFLVEVAYARGLGVEKQDRKCFYFLPLCPVYGVGALLILAPAARLSPYPALAAGWSALAATAAEYAMSLFYEKALGVSFWDYAQFPGNLGGRVCPLFSAFWCLLGLVTVYGIQPLAAAGVERLPDWLLPPAAAALALDGALSVFLLRRSGSTDVLCWYRRLPLPILPNSKSDLKN